MASGGKQITSSQILINVISNPNIPCGSCLVGLVNAGNRCWPSCGNKSGTCSWCGTGKCCRLGFSNAGDCTPDDGISSWNHKCVCT